MEKADVDREAAVLKNVAYALCNVRQKEIELRHEVEERARGLEINELVKLADSISDVDVRIILLLEAAKRKQ